MELLIQAIENHTARLGSGGVVSTALPTVSMVRASTPGELLHSIYKPLACLVLQGRKMVTAGSRTLHFSSGDTLIVAAETPTVSQITQAAPNMPYLALVVELNPATLGALQRELTIPTSVDRQTVQATATDVETFDTFRRIVALLDRPGSIPSLHGAYLRELHYWLLLGKHGQAISRYASDHGASTGIGRALTILKQRFDESLSMQELAAAAGMSSSSFYEQFREATAMTPLQFQKQLRLIEAKRLMLVGKNNASSAAFRVGYESVSQFTREYHRFFGAPPARDNRGSNMPPQQKVGVAVKRTAFSQDL